MPTPSTATSAPARRPSPSASPQPKPVAPQSVEVTIWIPASRTSSGIAGTALGASANLGHSATARCTRWGRHLDGSVSITIETTVTTPPGVLPPFQTGDRT